MSTPTKYAKRLPAERAKILRAMETRGDTHAKVICERYAIDPKTVNNWKREATGTPVARKTGLSRPKAVTSKLGREGAMHLAIRFVQQDGWSQQKAADTARVSAARLQAELDKRRPAQPTAMKRPRVIEMLGDWA